MITASDHLVREAGENEAAGVASALSRPATADSHVAFPLLANGYTATCQDHWWIQPCVGRNSRYSGPGECCESTLSGVDRHDFALSKRLDVANWGLTEEPAVLTAELADALVPDLVRRARRI